MWFLIINHSISHTNSPFPLIWIGGPFSKGSFFYPSLIPSTAHWLTEGYFFIKVLILLFILYFFRIPRKISFNDGSLGSRNDEERRETRYVMWIAGLSESSNLWTQIALSRFSRLSIPGPVLFCTGNLHYNNVGEMEENWALCASRVHRFKFFNGLSCHSVWDCLMRQGN